MSSFIEQRRDPLLSEDFFLVQLEDYKESLYFDQEWWSWINDPHHERWSDPAGLPTRSGASAGMFMDNLEHLILLYSGGVSHEEVIAQLGVVTKEFLRHKKEFPDEQFYYWEQDAYQYLLWMFSLNILYGQDEMLPELVRYISKNPEGDDDPLWSVLLARLGYPGFPRGPESYIPEVYRPLFDAIKGDGVNPTKVERQASIKQYLKGWYKGCKECYWHDRHKAKHAIYFGYWAFEAALVTLLYELDDSSYRDMRYYPKDLVDYARANGIAEKWQALRVAQHPIAMPGSVVEQDGNWRCNLTDEQWQLRKGQRLPSQTHVNKDDMLFWVQE
ncbi:PoNi-like cognate immunity protein [Aeromonas hydrophila]|uniref:PoNi-like cognate immunity protein n=1 Tax=Aeromonas hydrophila TaxID=644 RepID=UPI00101B0C5C|nr:PoNi-like cognate immunity protein [Aeromonas hydrophila]MCO4200186.1 PoNi-like cognate immunity protein [Aeromonas hydrophila]UNB56748.1 PoNi-like cognate immunity protein [Aeromonas hydrophila]BBG85484.1 1829_Type VI secretion system protein [Aeromonas hydrophila]BBT62784.1 1829_Type VI secretion system protein [Aeromonas hydrophila]